MYSTLNSFLSADPIANLTGYNFKINNFTLLKALAQLFSLGSFT